MTRQEARAKWCPMALNAVVVDRESARCASANRDSSEHYGVQSVNCIADDCMMWIETKVALIDSEAVTGRCGLAR